MGNYNYNYNSNNNNVIVNNYNSYASGGNAYGGNAYGGNAYGGNAYGGNAYGGNAYGGNAYAGSSYAIGNYIGSYINQNTNPRIFIGYTNLAYNSYSSNNFFDVGISNGYLKNFQSKTSVMNFLDVNISHFSRNDDYLSFTMSNGTSFQAQTSSSENEIFQYSMDGHNISYAKIGYQEKDNRFKYEDGISVYVGGSRSNVLEVETDRRESIEINLADSIYQNINQIDATTSRGSNKLFGNTNDNEIRAGKGNDKLWGGKGGNDLLYGGAGDNTFYYGVREGNDTIYNSVSSDKINLYNVSLSDIVSAGEVGQDFVVNMASGESLTIKGKNGASNFVLSDHSAYSYSRESHTWTQTK